MYITKRNFDVVIQKIIKRNYRLCTYAKDILHRTAQTAFILLVLGILYAFAVVLLTGPVEILGPDFADLFTRFGFSLTGITNIVLVFAIPLLIILIYHLNQARKDINFTLIQILTNTSIIIITVIPFMLFWRILIGFLCLIFLVKFFYFMLLPQLFLTFSSET